MGLESGIGLLGGSFDPVHNGHLQLARDALLQLPLDHVRFVPAAHPWQKDPLDASAEHRAMMVKLAIAAVPRSILDLQEIDRGGITYTIDTVRALHSALPGRPLMLIMGSDQFARFETWRDWRQILELAAVAVAHRQGTPADAGTDAWPAVTGSDAPRHAGRIIPFPMAPIDVSATEVRRLLREPPSFAVEQRLAAMVPGAVLDYIRSNRLYRKQRPG